MYWPIYSLLISYTLLSVDAVQSLPANASHRSISLRKKHLRAKQRDTDSPGGSVNPVEGNLPQPPPDTTPVPPSADTPPDNGSPSSNTQSDPPDTQSEPSGPKDNSPDTKDNSPDTQSSPPDGNGSPSNSDDSSGTTQAPSVPTSDSSESNVVVNSSASNAPSSDNTPPPDSTPSSDNSTPGNASPTNPPSGDPLDNLLPGVLGTPDTATGTPSSSPDTPDPTVAPAADTGNGSGGVVDGLTSAAGNVVDGATTAVGAVVNGATTAVGNVVDGATTAVGDVVGGATTTVDDVTGGATSAVSDVVGGATSTVDDAVGGATSTVDDAVGGATTTVDDVVGEATTAVGDAVPTITSAAGDVTSVAADTGNDATSAAGDAVSQATSAAVPDPTDAPESDSGSINLPPPPTSEASGVISQVTSAVDPEPTIPPDSPALTTVVSDVTTILDSPAQNIPTATLTDSPSTESPPSTGVSVHAAAISSPNAISFPTGASGATELGTVTGTEATRPTDSETPAVSVESNFSFLTQSTLIVASVAPTAAVPLTDPDQPTTTLNIPNAGATNSLTQAALPTGIPSRIFPQNGIPDGTDMSGLTLISILFNSELNWPFVASHQDSSSQIFAFFPTVLQTALGLSADQVKTYGLQVYVPATYQSDADAAQLGTMYLGYVPSDLVDTLAAQMKAKSSAFYTGSQGVALQLALRVDPAFSLNAIPDPNPTSGGNKANGGSRGNSSAKARQDAIIGVVSALGGVALIILAFLVYRSWKRRQELAHRRLSDPPGAVEYTGERPDGREFDQDSVGGQRRRSFYFAEDSLQGYQGDRQDEGTYDHHTTPSSGMVQRRNLVPGTISAPILRGSTMNW